MQDDFFAGVDQVEVRINGGKGKFPVFYRDARMFNIVLPASYAKLRKILPDPRFTPAQVFPGVGAVALTALEYYDTDIEPYNEFSMGIILNSPYYQPVPGYNLLRQLFSQMINVYIWHLPVTTEIALRGGIDFYNYPKFMADIDFSDTGERVTCDLVGDGEQILTVSGEKVATSDLGEFKLMCNLYQNRQPQVAEFKMNVPQGRIQWLPTNVSWGFNRSSEIGSDLASLVLGKRALQYFYFPRIQCILYGPEYMPMQLMRYVITRPGFLPEGGRPDSKPAGRKAAGKKAAGKKAAGKKAGGKKAGGKKTAP